MPPSVVDFLFNESPTGEFSTAQVNAFVHITKTHDYYKQRQPGYPMIDVPLTAKVNLHELYGGDHVVHDSTVAKSI
jgi:hypothetical protein